MSNRTPLAVQEMQILDYLRDNGETHTTKLGSVFEFFETRKELSRCLGNMNKAELITKNNPGRWSLTAAGREMLDMAGYPAAVEEGNKKIERPDFWELLGRMQAQVPDNASLVIEAAEVFFVVAGQKFEVQSPGDFEAMQLVADRYIGQVA